MSDDAVRSEVRELAERYEFVHELGRGRTAIVYLARERVSGRNVTVKLLHSRFTGCAEALRRFARDAGTGTALQHRNIVQLIGIEDLGNSAVAIIAEYIHGETLRAVFRASGPLSLHRSTRILQDISAALAHAHAQGIAHGDLRPENILIEADTGRALVADFGISRALGGERWHGNAGSPIATPTYMSPEQACGRPLDERSDIYALALIGWEMLTGLRPWSGEPLQSVLHKQKYEQLPALGELRPDTPAFLMDAITRGLEKEPDERWQNGSEFLARLTPAPRLVRPAVAFRDMALSERDTRASKGDGTSNRNYATRQRAWIVESHTGNSDEADHDHLTLEAPRDRGWWPAAVALGAAAVLLLALQWAGSDGSRRTTPVSDQALDSLLAQSPWDSAAGSIVQTTTPGVISVAAPAGESSTRTVKRDGTRNVAAAESFESRCHSTELADQRACLLAHIERSDAALTEAYQALIADLRRNAGGAREPKSVQALRIEQRAWLGERDRVCRSQTQSPGNPLWGKARAPCFAELSEQRATELKKRLGR